MSGKKGRSGRKLMRDSERRYRVIEKAWEIVERALHDKQTSFTQKLVLSREIVLKNIPQQHDGIPPANNTFILISPKERIVEGRPAMVQI